MSTMSEVARRKSSQDFSKKVFHLFPLIGLVGAALMGAVFGPEWSEDFAHVPWLIALFFIGLPHGAADFAVSRRIWMSRRLVGVWLLYLCGMVVTVLAYAFAPLSMLVLFACLTTWHFGLAHADGDRSHGESWPRLAVAAGSRGFLVLTVPLLAWPMETGAVIDALLALTHSHRIQVNDCAIENVGLLLASIGTAAIASGGLFVPRSSDSSRWPMLLADLLAIAALGLFTHPLFSVGLYFILWHGWRQMELVSLKSYQTRPSSWSQLVFALVRLHFEAFPLVAPTLVGLASAWWLWSPLHTAKDLAILSIGFYLIVTPAHELFDHFSRRSLPMTAV